MQCSIFDNGTSRSRVSLASRTSRKRARSEGIERIRGFGILFFVSLFPSMMESFNGSLVSTTQIRHNMQRSNFMGRSSRNLIAVHSLFSSSLYGTQDPEDSSGPSHSNHSSHPRYAPRRQSERSNRKSSMGRGKPMEGAQYQKRSEDMEEALPIQQLVTLLQKRGIRFSPDSTRQDLETLLRQSTFDGYNREAAEDQRTVDANSDRRLYESENSSERDMEEGTPLEEDRGIKSDFLNAPPNSPSPPLDSSFTKSKIDDSRIKELDGNQEQDIGTEFLHRYEIRNEGSDRFRMNENEYLRGDKDPQDNERHGDRRLYRIRRQQRSLRRQPRRRRRGPQSSGDQFFDDLLTGSEVASAKRILGRAANLGQKAVKRVSNRAAEWSGNVADLITSELLLDDDDEIESRAPSERTRRRRPESTSYSHLSNKKTKKQRDSSRATGSHFGSSAPSSDERGRPRRRNLTNTQPDSSAFRGKRVIIVPGSSSASTKMGSHENDSNAEVNQARQSAHPRTNQGPRSISTEVDQLDQEGSLIEKAKKDDSKRIQDAVIEDFSKDPTLRFPTWRRKSKVFNGTIDVVSVEGRQEESDSSRQETELPSQFNIDPKSGSSRRVSQRNTADADNDRESLLQKARLSLATADNVAQYEDIDEEAYWSAQRRERHRRQRRDQQRSSRDDSEVDGDIGIKRRQPKRIYSTYSNKRDDDEYLMDSLDRLGGMIGNAADTFLWGSQPSFDSGQEDHERRSREQIEAQFDKSKQRRHVKPDPGNQVSSSSKRRQQRDGPRSLDTNKRRHWRDRMEEQLDNLLGIHDDDVSYDRWTQRERQEVREQSGYDAISYARGRSPKRRRSRKGHHERTTVRFEHPIWQFDGGDDDTNLVSLLFGSGDSRSGSQLIGRKGSLLRFFHVLFLFSRRWFGRLVRWASVRGALPEPIIAISLFSIGLSVRPKRRLVTMATTLIFMRLLGEIVDGGGPYTEDSFEDDENSAQSQ